MVDADSCPVKEEIVELTTQYRIETIFVASYAHMKRDREGEVWKFVDSSKEAVDLYIMNHVTKGDIVITQDIGLASTLLLKRVRVLSPRGVPYEESDIATALDLRYLAAKARRSGDYGKGPKPFRQEDRIRFVKVFSETLSNVAGIPDFTSKLNKS